MQVIRPESGEVHAAPMEGGPTAEVLVGGDDAGGNLAAARVTVPPGGGMPEHEHGDSEALVVAFSGRVDIRSADARETLEPGMMALIGVGERVSLENPSSSEPASLLAFFAPPGFVKNLETWPAAG